MSEAVIRWDTPEGLPQAGPPIASLAGKVRLCGIAVGRARDVNDGSVSVSAGREFRKLPVTQIFPGYDRSPTHCGRCPVESPAAAQAEQQTVAEYAANFCSSPICGGEDYRHNSPFLLQAV